MADAAPPARPRRRLPRDLVRAAGDAGAVADADLDADRPARAGSRTRSWSCRSGIEDALPPEYAQLFGITTLVCTPLSAAGRAYGVICADRGGGRFELSDGERHLLWTLGKTAALVATARNATRQQERNRAARRAARARARDPRARDAAPVRRVAGAERRAAARRRRARALPGRDAGGAERSAQRARAAAGAGAERDRDDARGRARPGSPALPASGSRSTGRRRVDRSRRDRAARPVGARRGAAQRRQARRAHAGRGRGSPRRRHVHARGSQRRRRRGRAGAGMGLRLAAFEALQHGGVVEFGRARGRPLAGAAGRPAQPRRRRRRTVAAGRDVPTERRLRVLVVDDHDVVHWGFRVLLGEQPWVERCLAARTGAEALALLPDPEARRRAGRPVPGRANRAPTCAPRSAARRRRRACC